MGRSFLVSILDLKCLNPLSRLICKPDDSLEQCLEKLREDIKRDLSKPSIKNLKKAAKKGKKGKKADFEFELVLQSD